MEKKKKSITAYIVILCILCIAINYLGAKMALALHLPVFFDCIGTMLAAALGGALPGVIVGYLTNLINGYSDPITMYYGILNVLIAIVTSIFFRRGLVSLKKPHMIALLVAINAFIGGALGSVVTWLLYGFSFGEGISAPLAHMIFDTGIFNEFWSQFIADMGIDLLDKFICVGITIILIRILPKALREIFFEHTESERLLMEAPEMMREMIFNNGVTKKNYHKKSLSLRAKVLVLLIAASVLITVSASVISFNLFKNSEVNGRISLGRGVSNVAAKIINADEVENYLFGDYDEDEYKMTALRLADLRENVPDVSDLYILSVTEKGTKFVFGVNEDRTLDLTPGVFTSLPEGLREYYADFLSGKEIPIVNSTGENGDLMSISTPIYNSDGKCVAYSIVDISTLEMRAEIFEFMIKVITLFFGVFLLILAVSLRLAETGITHPINEMAAAAEAFAYDSEEARDENVEKIESLEIHTGDEIEHLYYAIAKTTHDTMGYIDDVNEKNRIIMKMQNGLIMVLADMVEGRDQNTGDHVKKTAAYTRIILNKLREEGKFQDELTDAYIEDVVSSAPLHDVGKITISDLVLNKPGRLTDEEFEMMKNHTTAGAEIIGKAIESVSEEPGYLVEAMNLAYYHHERWDGKGYPIGLKGEQIPLSARVMAVADVFDALVSKRCYKPPFSFDKAMSIIEEEAGTHFDPDVAAAFIAAKDAVYFVANSFSEEHRSVEEPWAKDPRANAPSEEKEEKSE